jgi:hypothetical protein
MPSIIYPTVKLFQPIGSPKYQTRRRVFVIDAEFIKNERNASGMQFEERSKVLKRNGKV